MKHYTIPFRRISMRDLPDVGGKNASLGEMINNLSSLGVQVPDGFALRVNAFSSFLSHNNLVELLGIELAKLNRTTLSNLSEVGLACRTLVSAGTFPGEVEKEIHRAYNDLMEIGLNPSLAVRSSATAEDSPTASFAGQHDSFLNVSGSDNLLNAIRQCYASLFNDRAIKYRIDNGFGDLTVGISVGVQVMVRSDRGSAGVIFTIEPESGNKNLVYVTGAWGLGESVVQGAVNTDEFYLFKGTDDAETPSIVHRQMGLKSQMLVFGDRQAKTAWKDVPMSLRDQFVLTDEEVVLLGKWSIAIERHYNIPMDIEWAKDGTGRLFIVQARPETVRSRLKKVTMMTEYTLQTDASPILSGKAVGRSVVAGKVAIVKSLADSGKVKAGDIIVADITNPDWNALLRRAVCIVTNKGGRTSHASIVARELGIPAVVGTISATEKLVDGQEITVSCAEGDEGHVYNGRLQWKENEISVKAISGTRTQPMLILADPGKALLYSSYPNQGVGLLRMEFMITNALQIHPMALVNYDLLEEDTLKKQIEAITRHYSDKKQFFVDRLAESIGLVAAAFYPKDVIVRMSDFKTNEYAKLLGGSLYEPEEENPMLGFRGASRYYHERYRDGFGLECKAIKKAREKMMLTNIKVMIPFCRTVEEGNRVLEVMKEFGLERHQNGLEVYVMAEIPSNILLAKKFARIFDGFSIGSNDLTQLTLGIDRDSAIVSDLFDESNEAVKQLIQSLIKTAHEEGVKVGLCGQAPSDYPLFARFLVSCEIDSISFNPDALVRGIQNIADAEIDSPMDSELEPSVH